MKRIHIILSLCVVLIGASSCRTRPKLDLGYRPKGYTESHAKKTGNTGVQEIRSTQDSWNSYQEDTVDLTSVQPLDSGWELFTATPVPPRNIPIEEVDDRRWGPIYFAFNQSFIGETERKKLETLADYLNRNGQYVVLIEGHCDARGSDEYNRALGEKRAIAVRDYLASIGVDDSRMQTLSYGEERLEDHGDTENAHARNRRAEFVIGLPK